MQVIVVNTDEARFFDKVPALHADVPVALNLYQDSRIPESKLRMLRYFLPFLPLDVMQRFSIWNYEKLSYLIRTYDIDFIFAHWGVGILPEVFIVKSIPEARKIPVILNVETFPTSYSSILRQNFEIGIMKKMLNYINGLIIPSPEMLHFLVTLLPTVEEKHIYNKPMFYPKSYAPKETLPLLSKVDGKPHVVFMGQFDKEHSLNDVRNEIISLAKEGIVVHCSYKLRINHKNVVLFGDFDGASLTSGLLTSFMSQFDACLATYNLDKGYSLMRFRTSFPARFLISLAAGIPVILPQGKFDAMENFVNREGIGYAYRDSRDAYLTLSNSNWAEIVKKSKFKQKNFTFNSSEFLLFIDNFLLRRGK